jgi:tetratricopeptide (TPR) repeat protein
MGGLTIENIVWAFTTVDMSYWHPVTWLSHMMDIEFYGPNPGGHHLTSVVIHLVSTVLIFVLLFKLTEAFWQSAFVAVLFALHPLHVESVAWVAQRKDVLSAFFGFLALLFYLGYVKRRVSTDKELGGKRIFYILTFFCFVLGLMSKPIIITLPIIMLLIDYWFEDILIYNDGEIKSCTVTNVTSNRSRTAVYPILIEKIPFFACSLLSGVLTLYGQHAEGAIVDIKDVPMVLRIENALVAYIKYIGNTFWPHDLALLYTLPLSLPLWQVIGSLSVLLFVSSFTFRLRRRYPYLLVGWLWFLVTLVPVIGLIQVGAAQYMADRYTYIPIVGLFIMVGFGVPQLLRGLKYKRIILSLLGCLVITASAIASWNQFRYWRDAITLFQHTLDVTPPQSDNYRTHYLLGNALVSKGYLDAAIKEYRASIALMFTFPEAHNNLAFALEKQGFLDEAVKEHEVILQMNPNNAVAYNNLGFVRFKKGDLDGAISEYSKALDLSPNFSDAHNNLGLAHAAKGNMSLAVQEYQAALMLNFNNSNAHFNLGVAFASRGNWDDALKEYRETIRINPNDIEAYNNLELALAAKRARERQRN